MTSVGGIDYTSWAEYGLRLAIDPGPNSTGMIPRLCSDYRGGMGNPLVGYLRDGTVTG
jgi:hypothetical protein